ncbi:MAG: hypothetical protein V3U68_01110 [Bacteroidota bacterium]
MTNAACILLVFLSLRGALFAAFEPREIGARVAGIGGAFVGVARDAWSTFRNPCGLSQLGTRELSVSHSPALFGLRELAFGAFVYAHPTRVGFFALSASRFGFELYNETTVSVSYSNSYHRTVALGFTLRYHHLEIERYGSAVAFGFDAGILIGLSEQLHAGFFVRNINAPTIGLAKERLPQVYSTGISYMPVNRLIILVDLEKDVRFPASVKAGVEYRPLEFLAFRTGLATVPSRGTAGVGIQYSRFAFDYAVQAHPELGLTHQFSVSVSFDSLRDS